MEKLESWLSRSFMKTNPIIIPDMTYKVTLTNGVKLEGLSSKVTDQGFFIDNLEIFFSEIHDFEIIKESFEQFKKRKLDEAVLTPINKLKGISRDFKSFRGSPIKEDI